MSPNEYQVQAMRTECDQGASLTRIHQYPEAVRALHAVIGLLGDAGELATAIERWLYYGGTIDHTNIKEEIGDCLWYLAQATTAFDLTLEDVMASNIAKLRVRYPERYSDQAAVEENRKRVVEKAAMENPGWHETQAMEQKAIRVSRTRFLCPHCKSRVSDEIVRKLHSPLHRKDIYNCVECLGLLFVDELVIEDEA